jgi:hypothetical protein
MVSSGRLHSAVETFSLLSLLGYFPRHVIIAQKVCFILLSSNTRHDGFSMDVSANGLS